MGLRVYQSTIPLLTMIYEGGSVDFRAFQSLKGPESMQHRYITEDASCGVSLLISLAEYLKIDIPVTKAALCLAECINGEEYYKNGRTIEKLIINLKRL